jgi:hypothetical protein
MCFASRAAVGLAVVAPERKGRHPVRGGSHSPSRSDVEWQTTISGAGASPECALVAEICFHILMRRWGSA